VTESSGYLQCLVLCTSPLQLVIARSAMDALSEIDGQPRKAFAIMIHPLLLRSTKETIRTIGQSLGYELVQDYSSLYEQITGGKYPESRNEWLGRFDFILRAKKLVSNYKRSQTELHGVFDRELGLVGEVFCRRATGAQEHLFLGAVKTPYKKYAIEDGLADHLPRYWQFRQLQVYEIRRWAKRVVVEFSKYCVSSAITRDRKTSASVHFPDSIHWTQNFSPLNQESSVTIVNQFKKNIKKLPWDDSQAGDQKIVIFGSLLSRNAGTLDVNDEIDFYNMHLAKIREKHNVTNQEIWYKSHPRLSRDLWQLKCNRLKCKIFNFDTSVIAEQLLLSPSLLAVYSVGSTALIYAATIFGKSAFQLNLGGEPGAHPSVYKKYRYVGDKFGIPLATR
jgi:hypothetical protein